MAEEQCAEKALQYAVDHHLYRSSNVERHKVVGTALEQAITLTPEQIEQTLGRTNVIQRTRQVEGAKRDYVTTRKVLAAEKKMIGFARAGMRLLEKESGLNIAKVDTIQRQKGEYKRLPLQHPDRFEVYQQSELSLSVGAKIRFSLSGTEIDRQRRISNGRLDEVKGFDRDGNPVLKSGFTIDRHYGHVGMGYVITSHAS